MPVAEARVRTNGFQCPLNPFQLISWVVVASDVLLFAVIGIPLIEMDALKVLISLCFGASVGILVLAAYSATTCYPADPHIRRQDHGVQVNKEEDENLPYCPQCDSPVFARSKHCRACNKCVREFDHHCMWMNNCIGAENYKAFTVCIGSVAVMTANILGINVYLLIEFFVNSEAFEIRWHDHFLFQDVEKEMALIPCLLLTLVNLPFFILDMQLVLLHIFLSRENVTTYEYIMKIKRGSESSSELDQVGESDAQAAPRKKIRKLPRCLDWIVVDRKKMKKHPGKKKAPASSSASASDSEAPVVAKAAESAPPVPPVTAPPVAPQAASPDPAANVVWGTEGPGDADRGRPDPEGVDDERRSA